MKMTKNSLKIAALYTAIIMGAGFASGQELLQYFVAYGTSGIWGLMVSGVIFALTGWALLDICRREGIVNYKELVTYLMGKRLGFVLEVLVAAFLFVILVAMFSAGGAMLAQANMMTFTTGVLVVALFTLAALWFGLKGIVAVNAVLAPVMLVGGIFIGLYTFFNQAVTTAHFENTIVPGWVLAAVVYASYNMVTGVSVLASGSKLVKTPSDARVGGLLGGISLTILGICMALPLYLYFFDIIAVEIPFLVIVVGYGRVFTILYILLMVCAIATTAIINAFALIEWTAVYIKVNRRLQSVVLVLLAIPAAFIGFSNIVTYVYPLFGFIGVFQIVVILLSWKRKTGILKEK